MSLSLFARAYDELPPGEQALFADAVRRLLSDGLIWREEEGGQRAYSFLARHGELITAYLAVAGWDLRHDERVAVFQVVHRDGAHRRRLGRDTTIWLLLLRMLYAESREALKPLLTRYPTVTVGDVFHRYAEFFPGQVVRKKTSLDEALRTLQGLKLVRAAGGGVLRAGNSDQLVELLPTLEVVVPAANIAALSARLREYERPPAHDDDSPSASTTGAP